MTKPREILAAASAVLLTLLLCGCFRVSADELYSLPKASEEYMRLQVKIDEVLASGAEYSPPTGGEHRQSVQLIDIDGDGENEAVAFFVARAEDNPLRIYIFRSVGDEYEVAAAIEGIGTGIESVRYIDMDGDGQLEFAVGWQISSAVKTVTLHSLRDFQSIRLAQADYASIAVSDITGDALPDLSVVRVATADSPGALDVLSLMPDGEVVTMTAHMSEGVESVSKLLTGKLSDGFPAIFIDVKVSGITVTDVFCSIDGTLRNISRPGSAEELPPRTVASSDIDGDGVIEVPFQNAMPQQTETTYYTIDWCAYSSDGAKTVVQTTYHNYTDGWYLILPPEWVGGLTVRREDIVRGERAIVFSFADNTSGVHDFMRIYMLSGDSRTERARIGGRFELLEEGEKIYAAALFDPGGDYPDTFDEQGVRQSFRLVYSDWLMG